MNESPYSFEIDDSLWPTVLHYVYAKRFSGTEYEEEIRNTTTIQQLKRKMKRKRRIFVESHHKVTLDEYFGKGEIQYYDASEYNTKKYMKEAVYEKFRQNPRIRQKLLATRDYILVCDTDKILGGILMEVRESFRPKKKELLSIPTTIQDIPKKSLDSNEKNFIKLIIRQTLKVAKMEGWDKIYKAMIGDVLISANLQKTKLEFIDRICSLEWNYIYNNMPNYEALINDIQDFLLEKDNIFYQPEYDFILIYISSIVYLCRIDIKLLTELNKKLRDLHPSELIIGSDIREYRKNPPHKKKIFRRV